MHAVKNDTQVYYLVLCGRTSFGVFYEIELECYLGGSEVQLYERAVGLGEW